MYIKCFFCRMVAQMVKNLPSVQETQVRSLGQKDLLEDGMATPVFLPEKSHRQRSLGYRPIDPLQSMESKKSQTRLSN